MAVTLPKFTARDFTALKGLQGITDEQMEIHLKLYAGYVNRTNKLNETVASMLVEGRTGAEFQELRRRAGWEYNGMILHEYYFDNLQAGASDGTGSAFAQAVSKQWGDFETWKTDFLGVAKMPGVGWAMTLKDPTTGQLDNFWIDRHDIGIPAGYKPVVVLDLWEHAWSVYLKPTERGKYLEDFFANVNWSTISGRL